MDRNFGRRREVSEEPFIKYRTYRLEPHTMGNSGLVPGETRNAANSVVQAGLRTSHSRMVKL